MKLRRQGPYKRNYEKSQRRHFKSVDLYTGTFATLNGEIGSFEGFSLYVSNRMGMKDKRTFRRYRRKQGRICRATQNKLIDNARMEA